MTGLLYMPVTDKYCYIVFFFFLLIELLNAILWPRGHTMQIMMLWEKKAACRGASDIANCTICYQNRVFIVT